MALNIKDAETERLASEIAALTGESKTGAVRQALSERKQRLLLLASMGGPGDSRSESAPAPTPGATTRSAAIR